MNRIDALQIMRADYVDALGLKLPKKNFCGYF